MSNKASVETQYAFDVWPTSGCGGRKCKYCFYEGTEARGPEKVMTMGIADAVADFIERSNIVSVTFFGGEPLCNWPVMERIVTRVKKKIKWGVTTNGTLIDRERMRFMGEHSFYINLSFDGLPSTQNEWRDGTYEAVMTNLALLTSYPKLGVLKTLADPKTLYADVEHIRALGFKNVFINLLDPYGHITYDTKELPIFIENYKKVLTLHGKGILINDFDRWKELIEKGTRPGCGFTGRGLGCSPDGFLYPCHQGPGLPEQFRIGDVWRGVDPVVEKRVRSSPTILMPAECNACPYGLGKCLTTMWNKHKKFGVEAPEWYRLFAVAKIRIIEEFCNLPKKQPRCFGTERLLLCTLIDGSKYYLLKPFFTELTKLRSPVRTDYILLVNQDEKRLLHSLRLWVNGNLKDVPKPPVAFSSVRLIEIPIIQNEGYMFRIARARNVALGIARKEGHDNLGFIDADVLAPVDAIEKLLNVDAEIVGGLVKCRREEREGWYNNYIRDGKGFKRIDNFKSGDIIDVDATGSDCIIIRRKAFSDIIYEYKPEIPEAEDMGFCLKAKERGFRVKVHTGVAVKHVELKDVEVKV